MIQKLEGIIARMLSSGFSFADIERLARRSCLKHEMRQAKGNQCRAAASLGVHRNTFNRYLKEAQLDLRIGKPASHPVAGARSAYRES